MVILPILKSLIANSFLFIFFNLFLLTYFSPRYGPHFLTSLPIGHFNCMMDIIDATLLTVLILLSSLIIGRFMDLLFCIVLFFLVPYSTNSSHFSSPEPQYLSPGLSKIMFRFLLYVPQSNKCFQI